MNGEHPNGRTAVEGLTTRIMESPAPGVTREAARQFAAGVAKRHDAIEERVRFKGGKSMPLSQARAVVRRAVCAAIRKQPRYAQSLRRVARALVESYPTETPASRERIADTMLLGRLIEAPPLIMLRAALLEDLLDAGPAHADAEAAAAELVHPDRVAAALDAAATIHDAPVTPSPECETITIPLIAADFD